MAKTISDEQMKLSITINGDSAQKELFELEKSTRSIKNNVQFWYYVTIISAALTLIILGTK